MAYKFNINLHHAGMATSNASGSLCNIHFSQQAMHVDDILTDIARARGYLSQALFELNAYERDVLWTIAPKVPA